MTTPAGLANALRAHAQGVYCLEAAAELLIAQSWLQRRDFVTEFVTVERASIDGQVIAVMDWPAAITVLDAGALPCSGGEQRMLRITASLADGIPVDLRECLTGIDTRNVQLLVRATLHASGQRPSTRETMIVS
jgi:hypothetical protein